MQDFKRVWPIPELSAQRCWKPHGYATEALVTCRRRGRETSRRADTRIMGSAGAIPVGVKVLSTPGPEHAERTHTHLRPGSPPQHVQRARDMCNVRCPPRRPTLACRRLA